MSRYWEVPAEIEVAYEDGGEEVGCEVISLETRPDGNFLVNGQRAAVKLEEPFVLFIVSNITYEVEDRDLPKELLVHILTTIGIQTRRQPREEQDIWFT